MLRLQLSGKCKVVNLKRCGRRLHLKLLSDHNQHHVIVYLQKNPESGADFLSGVVFKRVLGLTVGQM